MPLPCGLATTPAFPCAPVIMPPTLFTDDLSFGGNTSGLLDCSTDALDELQPADAGVPSSPVKAQLSRATKARPSWGPPSTATAKNFQGTRLLDGLPEPPHWPPKESQDPGGPDASASQTSASASAAGSSTAGSKLRLGGIERGGKGKPRFSLFAKPVYAPAKRTVSGAGSSASGASAAPALPALMDDVPMPLADDVDVTADGPSESAAPLPTRDEYINEIAQLRALNNVFSGYDAMLQGTAEHIDVRVSLVADLFLSLLTCLLLFRLLPPVFTTSISCWTCTLTSCDVPSRYTRC